MRVRRASVVLALLVGGAVAVAAASRPWVEVSGLADAQDAVLLPVLEGSRSGAEVAPLVTASALVALAAAGALAVSGRVLRLVALVLAVAAGAAGSAATVALLGDPRDAASGAFADATGISGGTGDGVVAELTAWPWIALVGTLLVLVAAVAGLAQARSWKEVTRFEAPAPTRNGAGEDGAAEEQARPGDDWDALTRDEDPTVEDPRAGGRPSG